MPALSYEQMGGTVEEIAALIADWDSDRIEALASSEILSAAVMMGRRSDDGRHDRAASAAYRVLTDRGEGYRYQRAYTKIVAEQGYHVSESARKAAEKPEVKA
jgi:hypothetical protein